MLKDKYLKGGFECFESFEHGVSNSKNRGDCPKKKEKSLNSQLPIYTQNSQNTQNPFPCVVVESNESDLPLPPSLPSILAECGYDVPEWTPAGCQRFLEELEREWPGQFKLKGWNGMDFPEFFPVDLIDACLSIYAMALQGEWRGECGK